jgi:glycosyltransferase involved in cell wall biosynthesis
MNVLFIAPLPPPLTGNSLGAKVLYDELRTRHRVEAVNHSKSSLKSGAFSFGRSARILGLSYRIWKKRKGADLIYLSVAESFLGNMRDLLIYALCRRRLGRMVVHLLGGAGLKLILAGNGLQYRLNRRFLRRLGGVIVEGRTQSLMFERLLPPGKIHVVPNFAEDDLFLDPAEIAAKFEETVPLKLLFLSNLIPGKGYKELAEAYAGLGDELRTRIRISFVGGFASDRNRTEFLESIRGFAGLDYLGPFVGGAEKRALYARTHVFCLPTYYPFEGQPISILEAYATGCAVIATRHSGVKDIFADGINGFEVEIKSASSIRGVLERIAERPGSLLPIAVANRKLADERYRLRAYRSSAVEVLESAGRH